MGSSAGGRRQREYYLERETRTPRWPLAGDTHTVATLVGLDRCRACRGEKPTPKWWRVGWTTVSRRTAHMADRFETRGCRFDLTFCAPKASHWCGAVREDVVFKAIADAHTTALAEAMGYLAADAATPGGTDAHTGEKDLVWLTGLTATAYQYEPGAAGTPICTPCIVPTAKPAPTVPWRHRRDVLYHEAKAAGVIYQPPCAANCATTLGLEWSPVDPSTGMAELAGVEPADHQCAVATLHPTTRMGRLQPDPRRGGFVVGRAARGRAEGDAPREARRNRVGGTGGAGRADERGLVLGRGAFEGPARRGAQQRATPSTERASRAGRRRLRRPC